MFKKQLLLGLLLLLHPIINIGQTVGVVLSGGGAAGAAHVGFLKALEENEIPIDYITGTSMGAVIAAFYAAGYSVDEIEVIVSSEQFRKMSLGEIDENLNFYFKKLDDDASMITTKHSKGEFINSSLPTKLINPITMDMMLMEKLSQASAAANYNFDKLFVPYRCVASDIEDKESVLFKSGNLSVAARASASYPFYIPPVRYQGKLLYDGGIYNNFPSDVLYDEFLPDVILGNNVSNNIPPPMEDDLLSQLTNMIRHKTNFEPLCENMIILSPTLKVGTFDFDLVKEAMQDGYQNTINSLDSIQGMVSRKVTANEMTERRKLFKSQFTPLVVDKVEIEGVTEKQKKYISKILGKNNFPIELTELKKRFFRIFADDKIESVFPELIYNPQSLKYTMRLNIRNEKDLFVSFGGNFSSRPINMGFVGLRYNFFGKTSSSLYANSYFGKFYGSVHANYRFDLAGKYPFSVQPEFTLNRWDYFKSFATFFEDIKPSFIITNERFGGVKFVFPAGNKGKVTLLPEYAYIINRYYQTEEFSPVDTSDQTVFEGGMYSIIYSRNTLNRKYFPSKGTDLSFKAKYSAGVENTIPGSTAVFEEVENENMNWLTFRLKYVNYFKAFGKLQLGMHLEGVASNQPFFNNYRASVLMSPSFKPIPESKTFFIPNHHAYNFASGGLISVIQLRKNIDVRAEAYAYRPFGQLEADANNITQMNYNDQYYFLGSGSLIYHTPLGPASISANFYDFKENPWSFAFNFGYMIFNRSANE